MPIHKGISSEKADLFWYFLNPLLLPLSLADIAKMFEIVIL